MATLPGISQITRMRQQRRSLYGLVGPDQTSAVIAAPITVPISGGDDWPTAIALAAQAVALGVPLRFGPGRYKAQSRQAFPRDLVIVGTPKTIITADMTPTNNLDSIFCTGPGVSEVTSTLTATPALYASTINVAAALFPVGCWICIIDSGDSFYLSMHKVTGVSGGGLVLTLDMPLKMPSPIASSLTSYPSGSVVERFIPTENLFIFGNGMRLEGRCNRYVEFIRCNNVHIRDVICGPDASGNNALERLISLDSPSRNTSATNFFGDCGGTVPTGLGLSCEATVQSGFYQSGSIRADIANLIFQDAIECWADDCELDLCTGVANVAFTGASVTRGSIACHLRGGSAMRSSLHGVIFENSSSWCVVDGTDIAGNASDGVVTLNLSGAGTCTNNSIVGGARIRSNGANGIELAPAAANFRVSNVAIVNNATGITVPASVIGTYLEQIDVSGNVTPMNFASTVDVVGVFGLPAANHNPVCFLTGTADVRMSNASLAPRDANVSANTLQVGAGCRLSLSDSTVTAFAGGGSALVAVGVGAEISCSNVRCLQTGAGGTAARATAGGTIRLGNGFDGSACTTPVDPSGGGFLSIGTVVANGTTPVPVSWPNLRATDLPKLVRTASSGTPGPTPLVANTPGTGFSITASVADVSEYSYQI